jgi:glyoxylase-like metal-dependent hydrolase (beta-lactamase superfamily II)
MDRSKKRSRRNFLRVASGCAAHLSLMASPFPASARALWSRRSQGQVVAQAPFGRLERVGTRLWAFVSTPLNGDYTTVCNGGIISGNSGVLVVEAFQTAEGANWIARQARALTGRWPTHVLVTHYHSDHTGGVEGFFSERVAEEQETPPPSRPNPKLHATLTTRDLVSTSLPGDLARQRWADVVLVGEDGPSSVDLGGRSVRLNPRDGHTFSDLTVVLEDESVQWSGDLVWNGMFPNYMDAVPSRLSSAVRSIKGEAPQTLIPGHGPVADQVDLQRYVEVIDSVEEAARRAVRDGFTAEEAGARFRIPPGLGEWTLFNPSYFQRAIEAWMKEWQGQAQG